MKNDLLKLKHSFLISLIWVAAIWLVFLFEQLSGIELAQWGVYPRKLSGFVGIFTSPFIHGDWGHITSNSLPLLFLSTGVLYFYREIATPVLLASYITPGLWVWVAARSTYHIGASGVVYALVFFLFFSGVFRKDVRAMAISLVVAFLYGGVVWGILPTQPGVSWESHLFGAIAGTVVAFFYRKSGPKKKKYDWEDESDAESSYDDFAPWNYQHLYPPPDGFSYPNEKGSQS